MTHAPGALRPLALVACVACGACGSDPPSWAEASVPEPTVFAPGAISGGLRDYDISFTPDGSTAYFTRRARRGSPRIHRSRWTGDAWSDAEPVDFTGSRSEAPFVSPDGTILFFSSRLPVTDRLEPGDDLWYARRSGDRWSEPQPVPGPVNRPRIEFGRGTLGDESGPALLDDGSLIFSAHLDPEWGEDLYVAKPDGEGGYLTPEPLRINSYGDEAHPVLSPDGRWIVFQGYRDADAVGAQDLYATRRTEYGWSNPILLPVPINSPDSDGWPAFSPDGRHFFFASDRDRRGGYYDIYWVDVGTLGLSGAVRPRRDGDAALRRARR